MATIPLIVGAQGYVAHQCNMHADAYGYFKEWGMESSVQCFWYVLREHPRDNLYIDWRVVLKDGGEPGVIVYGDHGAVMTNRGAWLKTLSIPLNTTLKADYACIQLWSMCLYCGQMVSDQCKITK
jgi:hypothetical protein